MNFSIPSTSELLEPPRPIIWLSIVLTNVEGCLTSNTKTLYLISEKQVFQLCQIMSKYIEVRTKKIQ